MRSAFVRCSFRVTASWRSLPIRRFFSLTSFSKGEARSNSCCVASRAALADLATSSAAWTCFRKSLICDSYVSTDCLSSTFRTANCQHVVLGLLTRNIHVCTSCRAFCSPSTAWLLVSLSLAAFSYSSRVVSSCSLSSASFSARVSRNDRSFMASTSQSCMACLALSNSSRAYASREMSSSRSLIQFCWDRVDLLRNVSISKPCASFSCRSLASSSVSVLLFS